MSIPGFATADGTQNFAENFRSKYSKQAYSTFGRTDLTVSKLGFGTYRCHQEIEAHHAALKLALGKGCNVIDTSANYTDGNSEVLIGDVLNKEIVWGDLARENIVVVSKAGYIQGENMEIALAREDSGDPFPETVKYQQGLWHCIHPEFLEDQITRSLARMHLDTLDVYLLHNPEYFLSHAAHSGSGDLADNRKEFYDRIYRAFIQMEKLVQEGLIRYYGISSNSFPYPQEHPEFVSLNTVWEAYLAACEHSGISADEGHFAAIQLPFNWIEHQAATEKNNEYQGNALTVLEMAQKLELGVLINRPLNAIQQNRLLRLARISGDEDMDAMNYKEVGRLEEKFDEANPELKTKLSFSQKSLLMAGGADGVDVVLNGMRVVDYVADSMGIFQ